MSNAQCPIDENIRDLILTALTEDVGSGDITTNAIIPEETQVRALIRTKEKGVIAGLFVAREVFLQVDPRIKFSPKAKEGDNVKKGEIVAEISGSARGILTGERVAINFLQHLSGIATLANKFALQIAKSKSKAILLDTRKTIPGLRSLEKWAVKMGGGENHRMGLYDAVLVKDNHIRVAGGVGKAVKKVKAEEKEGGRKRRKKEIEVEVKTLVELREAVAAGAARVLLDNMTVNEMKKAAVFCKKTGAKTEASGGISLKNIAAAAKTGVDYISVGALTHSAKALDISLKVV